MFRLLTSMLLSCGRLLTLACSTTPTAPERTDIALQELWRVSGLANPESAALSEDGSFLYVSNANGDAEATDGNGFISRVFTGSRVLEAHWAEGLDAPKGIILHEGVLYVTDITSIVTIDARSGHMLSRVTVPSADFLNDVAIMPSGLVVATDSSTGRIFAIGEHGVEVWLEHALLTSASGLLAEHDRLLITTMQGRPLAADYATRELDVVEEDLGDADGMARVGDELYLVSEWPGRLFVVKPGTSREVILDTSMTSWSLCS